MVRRYPLKKNRQYNGQKVSIEEGQTIQRSEGIHWRRTDNTIVRRYPLKNDRQYNSQKVSIEEGQTIQWPKEKEQPMFNKRKLKIEQHEHHYNPRFSIRLNINFLYDTFIWKSGKHGRKLIT